MWVRGLGLSAALACLLGGCGTIFDAGTKGPRIYGGVRTDVETIGGGDPGSHLDATPILRIASALDLPFSLAADTLILPYTIFNELTSDPAPYRKR